MRKKIVQAAILGGVLLVLIVVLIAGILIKRKQDGNANQAGTTESQEQMPEPDSEGNFVADNGDGSVIGDTQGDEPTNGTVDGDDNFDDTQSEDADGEQSSNDNVHGNDGNSQNTPSGSNSSSGAGTNSFNGTYTHGDSPATAGALQVIGSQLCDASGNPVQLRGLSTHGMAWYPQYINNELFRQFHEEWGVNVIRLAMYTAEYGGYCTDGNQSDLKSLIADGVSYATDNDMYVIIDWHILSDGNPNTYKSQSKTFFEEMSKTYASYNNVIYEICNEPNGGTGWSQIKSYAEEIIPVIRSNDEDAIIIVGTPNWSQFVNEAAANPVQGYDNIMYSLHFYAATHQDSLRNTMTQAIDAGLPIFVTEYGICDASGNGGINETQANKWVNTMDAYGISYVAWNISNKAETSAIIKSSCSKTSGLTQEDLSDSGKWVYAMLTGGHGTMAEKDEKETSDSSENQNGGNTAAQNTGTSNSGSSTGSGAGMNNGSGTGTDTRGGTGTQNVGSGTGNNGSSKSENVLSNADTEISASVVNSWESGGQYFYQYSVSVKNVSQNESTGWSIDLVFNENLTLSGGWNGIYTVSGNVLHIESQSYNGGLASGGAAGDVGFIICGSAGLGLQ